MTYEEFKAIVHSVLTEAGRPLSWSEIKAIAGLPQKVPHNRWVRWLERDIGLVRDRSESGRTMWRIE